MMSPHRFLQRLGRRVGYEIRRYSPQISSDAQLACILRHLRIDLVMDIGANIGQYGGTLRSIGYRGRIVSFEPLSSAHAQLLKSSKGDGLWEVAPRMALGNSEGEVSIHLSRNSMSSSILNMLPQHELGAPDSVYIGKETAPLAQLDSVAFSYLRQASSVLLKIDAQGYEDRVLAGAHTVLERIRAIQIELSLVPLYEGQVLFDEMRKRLGSLGYELTAMFPVYVDEVTGQTLQIDGLFVRHARQTLYQGSGG
jgi:FkbM family methyltransferase